MLAGESLYGCTQLSCHAGIVGVWHTFGMHESESKLQPDVDDKPELTGHKGKSEMTAVNPDEKASGATLSSKHQSSKQIEIGGRDGPDPTRFGDWEKAGRCIDF